MTDHAPFELRPYQLEGVQATWDAFMRESRALGVLPTAAGKTEMFSELLKRFLEATPAKAIVLMNKINLVEQAYNRLVLRGLSPFDTGIYCGSLGLKETEKRVIVASIQSIFDIPPEVLAEVKLVIVDEAHNLSDEDDSTYQKFIAKLPPNCKISGWTATPFRASGYIYGPEEFFPRVTFRRTLNFMIEHGYIVRPILKKPDQQFDVSGLRIRGGEYAAEDVEKLTGDEKKVKLQVKDALERLKDRRKIVWACSSIAHAELVRRLIQRSEDAAIIHSKQTRSERESYSKFFETGEQCRHLVFVTIVSEGYDFKPIDAIVLFCPMRSPGRYIQTVGRGLRTSEATGKKDCLCLDYGKIVETIGPLDNPLIPGQRRKKAKVTDDPMEAAEIKSCPACLSYIDKRLMLCPDCGHVFPEGRGLSSELTSRPDEVGVLLSGGVKKEPPKVYDVKGVMVVKHLSKSSGNLCVKIEYEVQGVYWPICEYFTRNEFSWPKGIRRLRELGWLGAGAAGEQAPTFDEALDWIEAGGWAIEKVPTKLIVKKDGKWDRITGFDFTPREPGPSSGPDVFGQSEGAESQAGRVGTSNGTPDSGLFKY